MRLILIIIKIGNCIQDLHLKGWRPKRTSCRAVDWSQMIRVGAGRHLSRGRVFFLIYPFIQVLNRLHEAHPHWKRQRTSISPRTQYSSLSDIPSQTCPENTWGLCGLIKVTINEPFMEPSQRNDRTLAITTSRASELFCTIQDSCRIYKLTFHAFLIFVRLNLGTWDSLHVGIWVNKAYGHRCRWLDVMNSVTLLKLEIQS